MFSVYRIQADETESVFFKNKRESGSAVAGFRAFCPAVARKELRTDHTEL